MIVVDTSVWVDYFRRGSGSTTAALQRLLDQDEVALAAPVLIELLSGVRSSDFIRLRRVLSALPVLSPTNVTWTTLQAWVSRATTRGQRFGVGDLLVGGIAAENGSAIWSLDADFKRMESLGFVRLHSAR